MGNIVKLVFQAVATGSGLSKLYGEVKGLASAMPGLTKATIILGSAFGTTGAAFGRMATMLLQGGIWGVAAEGAKLLIDKLGLFKDKTEETKKQLDKLREATERYHEAILKGNEKALAYIDKETAKRNAQLDIINRMIKAELELQRARAIESGDVGKAESIGREIERRGGEATLEKAMANEKAAERKHIKADEAVDVARFSVKQLNADVRELKEKIFKQRWGQVRREAESNFKLAFGKDAKFDDTALWNDFKKNFSYRDDETAQIDAAKERLKIAEKTLETARRTAAEERARHQQAKNEVKALAAEQKAADENARAQKMAAAMKAEKERVAAEKKAIQDLADEDAKKERERLQKEAEDAKRKAIEELQAEVEARNKARQDALRKDIEADRQRVAELEARLADARAAVPATIDVLGNAAGMDQAGELRGERQAGITDRRFNDRFTKLLTSGRIKQDANGNWKIDGRASNLDNAVLDRLNANEKVKRAEAQAAKERQRLEKMEGYLKTISETIKTATEI